MSPPAEAPPAHYDTAQREAWRDGWTVAMNGHDRLPRPNYLTQQERDAFDAGWWLKFNLDLFGSDEPNKP